MSLFHDSVEWKKELAKLVSQLEPDQSVPVDVFKKFIEFFNTPIHTWKIPIPNNVDDTNEVKESKEIVQEATSLTEQVILEQVRHYLWNTFYKRLVHLNYEQGEIFHIQHLPLQYDYEDVCIDEFPPHSLIFEGCTEGEHKFLRIWTLNLPNDPKYIYEDGESFTQYYEYAKLHVPKLDELVHSEEDLMQVIKAEKDRHEQKPYATIAGQRDKEPGSVLYFYWGTEYFFSAELFVDHETAIPYMCYNPHLYPYPVQYFRAKNYRKFRYLI